MTGLDGKVAIVTGGGSGLGEAIGKALAQRGVKVVLSDINLKGADRVAGEIRSLGGTASAVQQDTAKSEDSERVVIHAVTSYGALHYAVNNAGIGGAQAPAAETDLADWNRVININLNGVLYGMRYQIPAMLKGGARECAIVNMASIHGTVAAVGNGAYTGKAWCCGPDQERRGGVRAAGTADQLRRPGVHRHAAPDEPSAGCSRATRCASPAREAGPAR